MFKTMTIAAVSLVMLCASHATAQGPDDFKNNYGLKKIGGQDPAKALATWGNTPHPTQVAVGRIKVSATYYTLEGTMLMSDGSSVNFNGNLRKGPAGTTWWHGVMSTSPNSDAQKALPYSVTLIFYTQTFQSFNADVSVLSVSGAANFGQTGASVWSFAR